MSLEGLFALGLQTESIQASSPSSQGKGESLDGLAFLNVLAPLWEHYGDWGGQTEEEPALKVPESKAEKDVDPQLSSDPSQSVPDLGADFLLQGEALAVPAPDASAAQARISERPVMGGSAGPSKLEGEADSSGFQKASADQPSKPAPPATAAAAALGEALEGSTPQKPIFAARGFDGRNASPLLPWADQDKAEASAQQSKAASAEAKIAHPPSGRPVEVLQRWEALARPFEPEGTLPPRLERILEGSQEISRTDQSILRSSIRAALASQAVQPEGAGAPADRFLARDPHTSSPNYRPTPGAAPKAAPEPSAEDGGEPDPSRQSHSAARTGVSSANPQASSQAASSGVRFADLLQAQSNAAQPGTPLAQAQPAKASATTGSGEGMQADPTTVRGQDADHIFSQVVQNARLLQSQGEARFEIRLKPEFLGRIQIETHLGADQKMTTRFLVEDPQVRSLLESRLPLLAERLGESGVRMSSLEVHSMNSQSPGDLSRSAGEAAGQSRQQQQDSGRQGHPGPSRPASQHEEEIYQPQQPGRHAGRIYLVA